MIEKIETSEQVFALILRRSFNEKGIHFFTPSDYSQQLGYMNRAKGYKIPPHLHKPVKRVVNYTKEVLFIKSGKVEVDFFDNSKNHVTSSILEAGDVILLAYGGHGFRMLEDSEIIEVKQGPYAGDQDKERFEADVQK